MQDFPSGCNFGFHALDDWKPSVAPDHCLHPIGAGCFTDGAKKLLPDFFFVDRS